MSPLGSSRHGDDSSKYFQQQYARWVMVTGADRSLIVYDKPSVQCDCDARRPMSAVGCNSIQNNVGNLILGFCPEKGPR